eukprot:686409-Amorphochlora_amoeboformis.AAC.1
MNVRMSGVVNVNVRMSGVLDANIRFYVSLNDLDPETWMLGLDLDATEHRHMTGVGWPPPGE